MNVLRLLVGSVCLLLAGIFSLSFLLLPNYRRYVIGRVAIGLALFLIAVWLLIWS